MHRLFVYALLIYPGYSWILQTTPKQIFTGLTKKVKFECSYDNRDNGMPHMASVFDIVIHRFYDNAFFLPHDNFIRYEGNQWYAHARVRARDHNATVEMFETSSSVSVQGQADKVHNSLLSMTWPNSESLMVGQYVCEINGKSSDGTPVQVVTDPVFYLYFKVVRTYLLANSFALKPELIEKFREDLDSLRKDVTSEIAKFREYFQTENLTKVKDTFQNGNLTKDFHEYIDSLRKDVTSEIANFKEKFQNENITKGFHEGLDNLRKYVTSEIAKVKVKFQNEASKLREDITRDIIAKIGDTEKQEKCYEHREWPSGRYALLSTNTGCLKSNTTVWTAGYIRFHSELNQRNDRQNAESQPNHLAQPVFEKETTGNFVNVHTCKHSSNTSGPAWPKGSYCIHRVGGVCPPGFEHSSFQLDAEDKPAVNGVFADGPDVQMSVDNDFMIFFFCCRSDVDAATPIILPVNAPFYLYRFKGTCQSIDGAKVSEEWLRIDTEETRNGDRYRSAVYPDSTLNPFYVHLCYYTKSI